ncbi:hypothetical protein ACWDG1_47190 [Streptomyces sp. NPDC001177]
MSTLQMLSLLLALSMALHIGCAAAFTAWRAGTHPSHRPPDRRQRHRHRLRPVPDSRHRLPLTT